MKNKEYYQPYRTILHDGEVWVEMTFYPSNEGTSFGLKINEKHWKEGRELNTSIVKLINEMETGTGEKIEKLQDEIIKFAEKEFKEIYKC